MFRNLFLGSASAFALSFTLSAPLHAQQVSATLDDISVTAPGASASTPPIAARFQLPQTSASITGEKIAEQVNIIDTEDAVKYLPSLFVRKRNNGDTQPVLATRSWGVSSSARSLVYADDILLTALIANDNNNGSPRWGLISPEEIARIDMLYGPFAAAYPGNSMGGVLQITTKPIGDKPEATFKQTEAFQTFGLFGTSNTYRTDQTALTASGRIGSFSDFFSINYQNSYSQPLTWITSGAALATLPGAYAAQSKTGTTANVVGAGGLLHTQMLNIKNRADYGITDTMKASWTIGFWSNDADSSTQNYTTGGFSGWGALSAANRTSLATAFGNATYNIAAKHLTNAVSLKTDSQGVFDWELAASHYIYLYDSQRSPFAADTTTGGGLTAYGKVQQMTGTNWFNLDAKGIWRPQGKDGPHIVSFGGHFDQYTLENPTYKVDDWRNGPDTSGTLYSYNKGSTQTAALWAQDAWRLVPDWHLTLGARLEAWRAFNGYNYTTTTASTATTGAITSFSGIAQPEQNATAISPKAVISHDITRDWNAAASFGVATRFPTVSELYKTTTSGANIYQSNPNLRPETAYSSEFAVTRKIDDGQIRLSLFAEFVRDALVSQTNVAADGVTLISSTSNIDLIRNIGFELAARKNNVMIDGLELSGSATFVDGRILANSSYRGTANTIGNRVPNIPDWKLTGVATYRPDPYWAITGAVRYSGWMQTAVENTDIINNVYGAFDPFIVFDAKVSYKYSRTATLEAGIDNIGDYRYTFFHPFPGRTFSLSARFKL